MIKEEFNLNYLDDNGSPIKLKRIKKPRSFISEDGRRFSHTYVAVNFEFIKISKNRFPVERNINGFAIKVK
jgi:hypothetical protein